MIGKTKRFEIFKRDGFTCQYCGQRPPDVVLEVDHIEPRAKGGSDDDLNLVTACFDCNRGKRDRKLGDVHPRPDADLQFLAVQQEIAEVKRYLEAKEKREAAQSNLIDSLIDLWAEYLTSQYVPSERVFKQWLARYSPQQIDYAIRASGLAYASGRFGWNDERAVDKAIRYVAAVLRNRLDAGVSDDY